MMLGDLAASSGGRSSASTSFSLNGRPARLCRQHRISAHYPSARHDKVDARAPSCSTWMMKAVRPWWRECHLIIFGNGAVMGQSALPLGCPCLHGYAWWLTGFSRAFDGRHRTPDHSVSPPLGDPGGMLTAVVGDGFDLGEQFCRLLTPWGAPSLRRPGGDYSGRGRFTGNFASR
jgi:hypothetical protein